MTSNAWDTEIASRDGQPAVVEARQRAVDYLLTLQRPGGCWEGEMVWCTMILSQVIIVRYIVGRGWDEPTKVRIIRHYEATQTAEGVWGLHPESGGYVFTTTLAYVALRLLGLSEGHPLLVPARRWLRAQPGGVLAVPTWGKFWLALLDLYGYEGINPSPPELFLLPRWLSVHPRRYYCHTRLIYLAISYLYGQRFKANLGALRDELRQELYASPYESINFARHRHDVAETDIYVRPGFLLRRASDLMAIYERRPNRRLRRLALAKALARVQYEQQTSRHQALSPVNGLLNCLVLWAEFGDTEELRRSLDGVESWKWEDDELGLRYAGARSHTWDTAFAIQAIVADSACAKQVEAPLRRAYQFLSDTQLHENLPNLDHQWRDSVLGGWCFSDGRHRWPVSDCTSEALSAILGLHDLFGPKWPSEQRLADERLRQAVVFILARQNRDGGFGTYERRRGSAFLESLNPSEMFGDCMTERSYLECTGSALAALAHYQSAFPQVMKREVSCAMHRAARFLRRGQGPDGAFAGFWGINFTYGTFHVVRGLRTAGLPPNDPTLERAASWLISKQRPDGGWGEHWSSCLTQSYVERTESQVVMTSWALLALFELLPPDAAPIVRGTEWLRSQQRPDGSWSGPVVNGVFFGTAMLDYRLYPAYFPTWALARQAALTTGA